MINVLQRGPAHDIPLTETLTLGKSLYAQLN